MNTRPEKALPLSRRDGLKILGAYAGGLLLAACTPRSTSPTVPTAEVLPTSIPVTPTAEISASPTPEAPKEGDKKVENGMTYEWHESQEGWFKLVTPRRIPILDLSNESNAAGFPDSVQLEVYVSENAAGQESLGTLTHPAKSIKAGDVNLTSRVYTLLKNRTGLDSSTFFNDLKGNDILVPFTTSKGPREWRLGPTQKVKIFIMGWEEAAGLSEWEHPDGLLFRSEADVDKNQDLLGKIASKISLDSLTPKQLIEMILYNMISTIDRPDQSVQYFDPEAESVARWALSGSVPDIQINP